MSGLLAAWLRRWPMWNGGQETGPYWVQVSLVLYLLPALAVPSYLIPRRKQRATALAEARSRGEITRELTAALHDRGVILFRRIELGVMVVVAVLMIAKPF